MKKFLKIVVSVVVVVLVVGLGILGMSSGLKSDLTVGLGPDTHVAGGVDVREYTQAPLAAEVKVYLPIKKEDALAIAYKFDEYADWVSPAPKEVLVDNSGSSTGTFGVGSQVTYKEGETDVIEVLEEGVAMIARPLWLLDDFGGHRGVVLITEDGEGSIMHMRRYLETKSFKGWMMSKMMPIFMESSAKNLVKIHGGQVY